MFEKHDSKIRLLSTTEGQLIVLADLLRPNLDVVFCGTRISRQDGGAGGRSRCWSAAFAVRTQGAFGFGDQLG